MVFCVYFDLHMCYELSHGCLDILVINEWASVIGSLHLVQNVVVGFEEYCSCLVRCVWVSWKEWCEDKLVSIP